MEASHICFVKINEEFGANSCREQYSLPPPSFFRLCSNDCDTGCCVYVHKFLLIRWMWHRLLCVHSHISVIQMNVTQAIVCTFTHFCHCLAAYLEHVCATIIFTGTTIFKQYIFILQIWEQLKPQSRASEWSIFCSDFKETANKDMWEKFSIVICLHYNI